MPRPALPCRLCSGLPCQMGTSRPSRWTSESPRPHHKDHPNPLSTLPQLRVSTGGPSEAMPWGSAEAKAPQPDPTPEAEWTLTFDPVATVQGDLAIDLGLVWLDDDEEPPGHRTVQLPSGPRVLEGGERVLVGSWRESWAAARKGGQRERGSWPETRQGRCRPVARPFRTSVEPRAVTVELRVLDGAGDVKTHLWLKDAGNSSNPTSGKVHEE